MDSRTYTVHQIYQDRRQYRVPFYQRAYVWNREEQWEPLWADIQEKAEIRLQGGKPVPHFMGAVVLEPQKKAGLLGVERHHIIDGQQRLTTLQYVFTALCLVLRELDQKALLPLVENCLVNANPETMEDKEVERFKLWPTFRDREQYVKAMTAGDVDKLKERFPDSFTRTGTLKKIGVDHPLALEAICYFREAMLEWAREPDAEPLPERTSALVSAVLTDLAIVCISLGEDDDAQVIFETLNGRGAELHATDLIRNFIFMRAGTDADDLYSTLWSQFEAPLWAEQQKRGRLNRPRLEWFVQTAVQAQTGEEIDIGRLYAGYRRCVEGDMALSSAGDQLKFLNRYAEHYRALVMGTGVSPIAEFGRRMLAWDASPTHPLALRVAAGALSAEEQGSIFEAIESYLVRRAVCGLSRKNYNKVFAQQLKKMTDSGGDAKSFIRTLAELSGEASRWPTDDEFKKQWLTGAVFPGRLDAAKLRFMFHRLEVAMRSAKSEERVVLSLDDLDIDHILPQTWSTYWPLADGGTVSAQDVSDARLLSLTTTELSEEANAIAQREAAVPVMGNLTMVHYGVNRSVQNREFAVKRQALFEHSNLQLNRTLTATTTWDEAAIQKRAEMLFEHAVRLWPGPSA
jgi:Protein of unknown function DUF262/Protein of unknown function (DUF1524)